MTYIIQGLAQLEREIAYLGGMCAASLMKKDIQLPPITAEEMEEDLDLVDEGAQQVMKQFINKYFHVKCVVLNELDKEGLYNFGQRA